MADRGTSLWYERLTLRVAVVDPVMRLSADLVRGWKGAKVWTAYKSRGWPAAWTWSQSVGVVRVVRVTGGRLPNWVLFPGSEA